MNIKEIVSAWLKLNDFDGLYNADLECGCGLDDLMPCDEPEINDCCAGVRKIAESEHEFPGDTIIGPKEG